MGVRQCLFASSGRAALVTALRAVRRLSPGGKDEVVLPSYTCFSVPAAVARAGLKIRLCDVDPRTLDYDKEALRRTDFGRAACLLSTSLYGIPNDLPHLSRVAKERGALLVDDAAQSLGSAIAGQQVGTFGAAGILSFDKGKNITSIEGGAVLCSDEAVAEALHRESAALVPPSLKDRSLSAARLIGYGAFLHPALYGIPAHLPGLSLGMTIYSTDFPLETYKPELGAMAGLLLERLDTLNAGRAAAAQQIMHGVVGVEGVETVALQPGAAPSYLRCPLLIRDVAVRTGLTTSLSRAGLGVSTSYPTSLDAIAEVRPLLVNGSQSFPGGAEVARTIITLPTHAYVSKRDIQRMIGIIRHRVSPARSASRQAS